MIERDDNAAKKGKPDSFEDAFAKLEGVVRQLEGGQLTLDKSMELFEEGMELSKMCSEMLNKAELRISKLRDDYGLSSADARTAMSGARPPAADDIPW